MSLFTNHFWRFFFGLVALVATGILVIYVAGLFDLRRAGTAQGPRDCSIEKC